MVYYGRLSGTVPKSLAALPRHASADKNRSTPCNSTAAPRPTASASRRITCPIESVERHPDRIPGIPAAWNHLRSPKVCKCLFRPPFSRMRWCHRSGRPLRAGSEWLLPRLEAQAVSSDSARTRSSGRIRL